MNNLLLKSIAKWKKHWRTVLVTLAVTLGEVGLGAIDGYTAPAVPNINLSSGRFHLSQVQISFVASSSSLGGLVGGSLSGIIMDRIGRKTTLIFASVPVTLGWMLITTAPNVYLMCLGRFLTGLFSGTIYVGAPLYVSEVSSPSVRGFMGSCCELFCNVGLLYVYTCGAFLSWKWLAVVCQMVPTLMLPLLLLVPESPRWLMKVGRTEECQKSLEWLRGADEDITQEMMELEKNVQAFRTSKSEWTEFLSPKVYRPLLVIIGLMLFQQLTGTTLMYQYMVTILRNAGGGWDPFYETAIFGLVGVIANLISAIVVDRVGRRTMLLVSGALMTLSLSGLAVYFTLLEVYSNAEFVVEYSKMVFACVLLYNVSVSLGYGPIPFYLASEMLPLKVRGMATGLSLPSVSLFAFVTSLVFPYTVDAIGYYGVFWFMTGCGFLSIIFAFVLVPETKGLSLEAIENSPRKLSHF